MTLIDRYIYAVTRRLPEQQREDIAKELRSLIEDLLAERTGAHEATEEDVETVLTELGEPAKLAAAKYTGRPRSIIGPELYDPYLALLKVVLPAVAFAMLLSMTIRYAAAPPQSFGQIFGYLSGTILWTPLSVVVRVFAWLTVLFAVIGRYTLRLALISTALSGVSLLLALFVFSQFSLWNQRFPQQLAQVFHVPLPTGFDGAQVVLISAKALLGLIIFAFVVEMAVTWVRTVRNRPDAQDQYHTLTQG